MTPDRDITTSGIIDWAAWLADNDRGILADASPDLEPWDDDPPPPPTGPPADDVAPGLCIQCDGVGLHPGRRRRRCLRCDGTGVER